MNSMPAPRKPKEKMPAKVREQADQLKNLLYWELRSKPAWALGELDVSAVPHLAKFLKDPQEAVRRKTVAALGEIGHESVVPPLAKALQDQDWHTRLAAAKALRGIGRMIQDKPVEGREAKALQMVAEHFHELEDPDVVHKAFQAALKGKVTKVNARLYVKQLRALQGSLK